MPQQTWIAQVPYLIENVECSDAEDTDTAITDLIYKMRSYGLEDIRIAVLVYKIVYKMSLREIGRELDIPHPQTVKDIYNKGLDLLKERGFKK